MDWTFLGELFSHGKIAAIILAALGFGTVLFKYLSDRHAAKLVKEKLSELNNAKQKADQESERLSLLMSDMDARVQSLALREESIGKLRNAMLGSDEELWRMYEARKPEAYDDAMSERDPPVTIVANLKGGVSKTTLCSNLAAHYARKLNKRVLVVDLDHQGSLSNMLLSSKGVTDVRSDVSKVLDPYFDLANWHSVITSLDPVIRNVDLISAAHDLAPAENKIMLDYLLQEPGIDRRYLLARFLQSEAIRETYGLIILDSPPRLTAAAINGLCAATHVLVPTVLDRMSAEAVGFFLASAKRLRAKLNPGLELLGVVGVMTDRADLRRREQYAKTVAQKQIAQSWPNGGTVLARNIPHRAAIQSAAGEAVAYNRDKSVKQWFDELGQDLATRLNLQLIGVDSDESVSVETGAADIPRNITDAFRATRH
jgi:chromosome partitioning protein